MALLPWTTVTCLGCCHDKDVHLAEKHLSYQRFIDKLHLPTKLASCKTAADKLASVWMRLTRVTCGWYFFYRLCCSMKLSWLPIYIWLFTAVISSDFCSFSVCMSCYNWQPMRQKQNYVFSLTVCAFSLVRSRSSPLKLWAITVVRGHSSF